MRIFLFVILYLVVVVSFVSCKKKEATTSTTNATSVTGTTGSSTTGSSTNTTTANQGYTHMKIDYFDVTSVGKGPYLGLYWDTSNSNDGPDLYFQLKDVNGNILVDGSNQVYNDYGITTYPPRSAPRFMFTPPYLISNLNDQVGFYIYDQDPGPDDVVVAQIFSFKDYAANHYVTIDRDFGGASGTFRVEWSN
jgi:hypothetical protein